MTVWKELADNPRLKDIYQKRLTITRLIREFFWSQNFLEADTPIALALPGQEPYLDPVDVAFRDPVGKMVNFRLQTSPEFAMKKLLAAGFPRLFQIAKCFRNGEAFGDGTHNTEFTMIEWYRAPGTLSEIMDDTEALFKYVTARLECANLVYGKTVVSANVGFERKTMKQLWQEYLSVNLDDYLETDALKQLASTKGYAPEAVDEYEDVFFKLFLNHIEPHLGRERPLFVYDYPHRLCSLSRVCDHDPRYAERAELYVAGLEIANGFGELTDAAEQKARLEADKARRQSLGKPTWPVDPEFIAALPHIAGPAGGIALGVDRMVLLCTGARDLEQVVFQTVQDQLPNQPV